MSLSHSQTTNPSGTIHQDKPLLMSYTRRVEGVLGQFSNRVASLTRKGGDSPPPLTSLLFQPQTSTLMTTEQILELAKEHLEEFDIDDGAECAWSDFAATKEQLIEFAQQIAEIEYNRGWKDREEVEYSLIQH